MNEARSTVEPKVRMKDLEVSYYTPKGRVNALGPLDLTIRDREFLSIVGPSGCGKSTLLRVLGGLIDPTAGTVEINFSDRSPTRISTVFQDFGILPWKTVIANVEFGLRMRGTPRREAREIARHWIARAGLEGFEDAYPKQLSGGMRQRVAIARAWAVDPEILLLDEPFASLDAQRREIMQEELLHLCRSGERTVVLITHSLDEAILLSDRVAMMSARPGRLLDVKELPFGRDHSADIKESREFAAIRVELWEHLSSQVTMGERKAS